MFGVCESLSIGINNTTEYQEWIRNQLLEKAVSGFTCSVLNTLQEISLAT